MTSDVDSDPAVRDRILEFLGGDTLDEATCEFITADDCSPDVRFDPRPVSDLEGCLEQQLDLGRSLWDRRSLIADLDIEYVNFSGHLWMLHASDNHGQYDDHLAPGDGKIAWQPLLEQLSQADFNGAMILEIAGKGTPETILDSARRGRAFLRGLSHRLALGAK